MFDVHALILSRIQVVIDVRGLRAYKGMPGSKLVQCLHRTTAKNTPSFLLILEPVTNIFPQHNVLCGVACLQYKVTIISSTINGRTPLKLFNRTYPTVYYWKFWQTVTFMVLTTTVTNNLSALTGEGTSAIHGLYVRVEIIFGFLDGSQNINNTYIYIVSSLRILIASKPYDSAHGP